MKNSNVVLCKIPSFSCNDSNEVYCNKSNQFKTKETVFQRTSIDDMFNARARENLGFIAGSFRVSLFIDLGIP